MHQRGANPISRAAMPRFHAASELRPDRDSDMVSRQWAKGKTVGWQVESLLKSVQALQRQLDVLRIYQGKGGLGGGWRFAKPIVYDMRLDYKKQRVVYVSDANVSVTTGHVQPDSTTVYATPGLWVAYKFPQTWNDSGEFWALPHWDNPSDAVILNTNVNPANHIYWIPIWTNVCG